ANRPVTWDKAYLELRSLVDSQFAELKNSVNPVQNPNATILKTDAQTVSFFDLPVQKLLYVQNATPEPIEVTYRYGVGDPGGLNGITHLPPDINQGYKLQLPPQAQQALVDGNNNPLRVLYFHWWATGTQS